MLSRCLECCLDLPFNFGHKFASHEVCQPCIALLIKLFLKILEPKLIATLIFPVILEFRLDCIVREVDFGSRNRLIIKCEFSTRRPYIAFFKHIQTLVLGQ